MGFIQIRESDLNKLIHTKIVPFLNMAPNKGHELGNLWDLQCHLDELQGRLISEESNLEEKIKKEGRLPQRNTLRYKLQKAIAREKSIAEGMGFVMDLHILLHSHQTLFEVHKVGRNRVIVIHDPYYELGDWIEILKEKGIPFAYIRRISPKWEWHGLKPELTQGDKTIIADFSGERRGTVQYTRVS